MRITGLTMDIIWKEPGANFRKIERELKGIETDLVLLPEMFSTGFCMQVEDIADDKNETLHWMQSLAKARNIAIAGSVSVAERGLFYNRFYFIYPNGAYLFYDKRHLFSYSGEDKIYSKGKDRMIVEYLGVRFLLLVCYDLRFPVFSRNKGDYDVILYVANWPQARINAWHSLLKARAIENLSYVFGLNRIGTDGNNLYYEESSNCFFADGSIVSRKEGSQVIAEIDLQKLKAFREKYGFLNDADDFQILI